MHDYCITVFVHVTVQAATRERTRLHSATSNNRDTQRNTPSVSFPRQIRASSLARKSCRHGGLFFSAGVSGVCVFDGSRHDTDEHVPFSRAFSHRSIGSLDLAATATPATPRHPVYGHQPPAVLSSQSEVNCMHTVTARSLRASPAVRVIWPGGRLSKKEAPSNMEQLRTDDIACSQVAGRACARAALSCLLAARGKPPLTPRRGSWC